MENEKVAAKLGARITKDPGLISRILNRRYGLSKIDGTTVSKSKGNRLTDNILERIKDDPQEKGKQILRRNLSQNSDVYKDVSLKDKVKRDSYFGKGKNRGRLLISDYTKEDIDGEWGKIIKKKLRDMREPVSKIHDKILAGHKGSYGDPGTAFKSYSKKKVPFYHSTSSKADAEKVKRAIEKDQPLMNTSGLGQREVASNAKDSSGIYAYPKRDNSLMGRKGGQVAGTIPANKVFFGPETSRIGRDHMPEMFIDRKAARHAIIKKK